MRYGRWFRVLAGVLIAPIMLVGCGGGTASKNGASAYRLPDFPAPSQFRSSIEDPYLPLRPGARWVYLSKTADGTERTVVVVERRTRVVAGVTATVVHDRAYLNGTLSEDTYDWFAQDNAGNVWYLGEDTATLDANGKVDSTDGTWRAGVDGGRAGIFMPAHPRAGQAGLQEYSKGEAEDAFEILHLAVGVRTPAVSSHHAMLVRETTRLEPGVVDHKIYVRGVGTVLEETVKGGDERLALVSVRRP